MTYSAVVEGRDDAASAARLAQTICRLVHAVLVVFGAPRDLGTLQQDVAKIAAAVVKWQDRARSAHVSYDYTTFLPLPGAEFVEDDMRREELPTSRASGRAPAEVVLPVAMGLKARRVGSAWDGENTQTTTMLKKAQVL